jgi:hypothetical protein
MRLKTRVFELFYKGKYENLSEMARAMGIAPSQVYRVRNGQRPINEKFILGAVRAFPGYSLDDLFYVNDTKET